MKGPSLLAGERLNELLTDAGLEPLESSTADRFSAYCDLLLRWNGRINLTSIRDQDGILARHFVESIAAAKALPSGIATLLDYGSGAGFPGIPIAICRPDIAVTLAESQGKKAAFLREAVRLLELPSKIHSSRAELLTAKFDCVILRAVDRMSAAVRSATQLVLPGGWLVLMTTEGESMEEVAGDGFTWSAPLLLPGSDRRVLLRGRRGDPNE